MYMGSSREHTAYRATNLDRVNLAQTLYVLSGIINLNFVFVQLSDSSDTVCLSGIMNLNVVFIQ